MEELEIVAILEMSCGNESVGEMWLETKVFPHNTDLFTVMKWANELKNRNIFDGNDVSKFRGNLRLTIKQ